MDFFYQKFRLPPDAGPDISWTPGLDAGLAALAAELLRWNKTHNLTGHRDEKSVALDLFLDSLFVVPYIKGGSLLDIGSGAGFPGLVLALAVPELAVTLLEARAKRVSFLKHAIRALGLETRTRAILGRAGEGALAGETFATVTCRALGGVQESLDLARPYAEPGGRIILPRGRKDQARAEELGLTVAAYRLPKPYGERILILADN